MSPEGFILIENEEQAQKFLAKKLEERGESTENIKWEGNFVDTFNNSKKCFAFLLSNGEYAIVYTDGNIRTADNLRMPTNRFEPLNHS